MEKTIGFLGPEGSYSSLAYKKLSPNTGRAYTDFYSLFSALESGEADCAVIPLENSIQGSITECLDLILDSKDFYITAETMLDIEHRLLLKEGAALEDVKDLYSHEQAIKQCGRFIKERLKNVRVHYTDSTARSASMIADVSDAGIVGSHFYREGCYLYPEAISDKKANVTRFVLIEKGEKRLKEHSGKIFIAVSAADKPGALLDILTLFKKDGLNMTKIESRPLRTKMGEYMFLIEFEGDIFKEEIKAFLNELKKDTKYFRLLGCY